VQGRELVIRHVRAAGVKLAVPGVPVVNEEQVVDAF